MIVLIHRSFLAKRFLNFGFYRLKYSQNFLSQYVCDCLKTKANKKELNKACY